MICAYTPREPVFPLWKWSPLFESKTSALANQFPHGFTCSEVTVASVTYKYWRRYDFSPLRHFMTLWIFSPWLPSCFVLRKCWRAISLMEQKSAGIFLNLRFWRKMSAGVCFVPELRRKYVRLSSFFPDHSALCIEYRISRVATRWWCAPLTLMPNKLPRWKWRARIAQIWVWPHKIRPCCLTTY